MTVERKEVRLSPTPLLHLPSSSFLRGFFSLFSPPRIADSVLIKSVDHEALMREQPFNSRD